MRPELVGKKWAVTVRDEAEQELDAVGATFCSSAGALQCALAILRDRQGGSVEIERPDGTLYERFIWDPDTGADGHVIGWRVARPA